MPSRHTDLIPKLQAQSLFQALPDLAFRLEPAGTILEVNAAAADRPGGGEALVRQRLQDSWPPAAAQRFAQALGQMAAGRDPRSCWS